VVKGACQLNVTLWQEMEVNGGGFYGCMAKKPFEGVEVGTMVEHMGGKRMPEDVDSPPPGDTGFFFACMKI
jgi:hypothetical protein